MYLFLKRLIKLLESEDDEVVAIAAFDIGEFVRHYPGGKAIAHRLGAKELVMQLIDHENSDVQRHALVCVSKMLVHNWQVRSRFHRPDRMFRKGFVPMLRCANASQAHAANQSLLSLHIATLSSLSLSKDVKIARSISVHSSN